MAFAPTPKGDARDGRRRGSLFVGKLGQGWGQLGTHAALHKANVANSVFPRLWEVLWLRLLVGREGWAGVGGPTGKIWPLGHGHLMGRHRSPLRTPLDFHHPKQDPGEHRSRGTNPLGLSFLGKGDGHGARGCWGHPCPLPSGGAAAAETGVGQSRNATAGRMKAPASPRIRVGDGQASSALAGDHSLLMQGVN